MRGKWFVTAGLILAGVLPVSAQYARPAITRGVNLEQKLNSPVPLDLVFHDESGQTVPLRTYFGDKPVVLEMVYFTCPSLCPMSMHESVVSLRRVSLVPGLDYNVVIVSFDPHDTPAMAVQKKAAYEKEFGRAGFNSGFHFLTGTQDSISKLASAIGFGYRYDGPSKQFIHAAGIMVATPDGKMSRYFYGIDYSPTDLRMALSEASKHRISSPVDYVLQFCFHYDPTQGKYTLAILNILKVAGCLTVLLLAGLIYLLMRNNKTQQQPKVWKEARHVG
ncbi:MAG TPA: SCO family protein [Bryobacteraceae bacterium]|nr:SCO family protein [Bryobacteraceae bacterium]